MTDSERPTMLSRRTVLQGLGVSMALPWLESLVGKESAALARAMGPAAATPPVRLACVFIPNGVNYDAWAPAVAAADGAAAQATASNFALSPTLQPLEAVRQHVSVLTGLTLDKARANGDGPGDHARSSASFLTGHQARKTAGNDIKIGVSVDQFAARQVGKHTRLPSLEIGCEEGPSAGNCDSGYSCAYSSNISWREENVPMPKLVDPGLVFERLFGNPNDAAAREQRLSRRQSILDFVSKDSKRLNERLGQHDRRKLDQFQTAVREIEQRIERARTDTKTIEQPAMPMPAGIPRKASEHIDLMYDLLLLSFQMDVTRVSTYMIGNDGSNRALPEIGVKDGHHHLSHHQNNAEMIEKIRAIDKFYVERHARFIKSLSETPEGDGTLLDNCMVLYGGGISDGNKHNHEDLPILLAGKGGGSLAPGHLITSPKETPLCNLYLSLLDRMGCEVESFGDGTGRLTNLSA